jgi:hypothetical protein
MVVLPLSDAQCSGTIPWFFFFSTQWENNPEFLLSRNAFCLIFQQIVLAQMQNFGSTTRRKHNIGHEWLHLRKHSDALHMEQVKITNRVCYNEA